MTTPTPPQADPDTALDQLDIELADLEADLEAAIDDTLTDAITAGVTAAALLAATAALATLVTGALRDAWDAATTAAPRIAPDRPGTRPPATPDDLTPDAVIETLAVREGIDHILRDAATRLNALDADRLTTLGQTFRRLLRDALTKLAAAVNHAFRAYAEPRRMELIWRTGSAAPCPTCLGRAGTVVAAAEEYAAEQGLWEWFGGLPPAHPNCRCRTVPVRAQR
ncbi:hypothetical protein [Streptomyces sp. ST2-7A]|uniref:hypothetical protein n=1 Tax=Streptomyces sp. ST2-7A TaxID=2907214 RepID=UPI001F37F01D|nr:hypothetical protein [Streptomyces sp. ST2-7A]MCE7081147.1 hypothetical protein [Streptomyces sp. ST2-7A]